GWRGEQERVAVRRGGRHGRDRELAAGAGPWLDHHRLAPCLLQVLGHNARENVGARPDNDFDWMVGKALRLRHGAARWREYSRNSNDRSDETAGSHGLTPYDLVRPLGLGA